MPKFSAVSTWHSRVIYLTAEDKDHVWRLLEQQLDSEGIYFYRKHWRMIAIDDSVEVAMEIARQRHEADVQTREVTAARIREAAKSGTNQGFLVYDPEYSPDLIFIDELQQALSSYLPVNQARQKERRSDPELFGDPLESFLQVVLISASTAIATGFLAKIGEDIWDKLKEMAHEAAKRDKVDEKKVELAKARQYLHLETHALGITFNIKAGTIFITGTANVMDYEGVAAALVSTWEMTQDAENRLTSGMDKVRGHSLFREFHGVTRSTTLFEYGMWFEYVYEKKHPGWKLTGIYEYKQ